MQKEAEEAGGELYQLPAGMKEKVEAQYRRDVALLHPEEAGKIESEYKSFLQELGGDGPPGMEG